MTKKVPSQMFNWVLKPGFCIWTMLSNAGHQLKFMLQNNFLKYWTKFLMACENENVCVKFQKNHRKKCTSLKCTCTSLKCTSA